MNAGCIVLGAVAIYIQFAIAARNKFFFCLLLCRFSFLAFLLYCLLTDVDCFFLSLFPLQNYFSGGCINASPAGKRRIASGVEQQQFGGGDDSLFGISSKLSISNDGNGNNGFGRITPATTAITAIAIAACVVIISVFAIVFVVLQVRSIFKHHSTRSVCPTNEKRNKRKANETNKTLDTINSS